MSDFIIKDGMLLSYNGTEEDVYVPNGVTAIAPGCFENVSHVKKIFLPTTIKKLGEDALGNATVYSENIPCVRNYMFRKNIFAPVYWLWYDEAYFEEYRPLHQKVTACETRLRQIKELEKNSKKDNAVMSLSAIFGLAADILLWCFWPWLTDTMAWLCGWLPWLFSAAAYVIAFGALWFGLFFVISMVALMFFGEDTYNKERKALEKQLEELKPRYSEMAQYVASKNQELQDGIRVESPVSFEGSSGDMTWHDGRPWSANHSNTRDL